MKFISLFKEISKNDAHIAGGKGASLGEMTQAGIPVPPGFVVRAETFERFIEETDINVEIDHILHSVDPDAMHTVESASENIQKLIKDVEMPQDIKEEILKAFDELGADYVAVRSSATAEDSVSAAWAGQLDSYLNTTRDNVLEKVQSCWASLFTPRAIFYRFEKELHTQKISVAVVVQKMVNSEKSGIAFSVHPVTEDRNQLIIEAGLGLGEAIVSGQITPDSYVVEKEPRRILDINVSEQNKGLFRKDGGGNEWRELTEEGKIQVLTEEEIFNLSEIILTIEDHYGFPCDIEWAVEGDTFYIVQSRPITTLLDSKKKAVVQDVKYNPNEYIRMFAGKGLGLLNSEIFLGHYHKFGVLSIQDEHAWMSFFPKKSMEKTLAEGAQLYTDKDEYKKYKESFLDFMKEADLYFTKILADKELAISNVKNFFNLTSKHFSFYSKTEFFYTDKVPQDKMVPSVQEFDKLKLDGRSFLNQMIFEDDGYVKSLLKKISASTNVSLDELLNYRISEIVDLITKNKILPKDQVLKRDLFFDDYSFQLFDKESRELTSKFFSSYREMSDVIQGTTAFGGIVRGLARVLLPNWKDFEEIKKSIEKMEDGDILIAETTSPELMSAIKKASAIITNQGGMLSHAAIIARELKIPCIIGTDKDVILNIKTGDEIEVDADSGVIKIL